MTNTDSSEHAGTPQKIKVSRLIEEYDLSGLGEELERRWTGRSGTRDSLRTLADVFNRRLLAQVMKRAGMDPLDGEVENIYRLLTDDEVSSGVRTEAEARLRHQGIDVDELRADFVTYQAVRTYLKEVRDASYETEATDDAQDVKASFNRLIGRTTAVVEQKLDQLRSSRKLTLGTYRVRTAVTVYCNDCGSQHEVTALLERGGCECLETEEG